jgi:hypothetical protein
MEFPCEWSVFPAEDFDTASPRGHGKVTMELFIQSRPNGRLLDHFRVATGGSEILTSTFKVTDVVNNEALQGMFARHQIWGRDIHLRRNMTSSDWLDFYDLVKSNEVQIFTLRNNKEKAIKTADVINTLDHMTGTRFKSAVIRFCAAVGLDGRMELELQGLPLPLSVVTGKPSFLG